MARTGEAEAKTAQGTYAGQADQAYTAGQGDLTQYRGDIAKLASGRDVGANPYQNPAYLGNEAKLQANALDAASSAGATDLRLANRRSGGLNTGATQGAISGLALQKMRLGDQFTAQRGSEDYGKNIAFQQFLANAPLNAAKGEEGMYGTATVGQTANEHELNQYGLQSNQAWLSLRNQLIMAAMKAAAGAAGAAGGAGSVAAGAAGGVNG